MDEVSLHNLRDEPFRQRQDSLAGIVGREGQNVAAMAYEGRSIGVFTSGGDSQGKFITVSDSYGLWFYTTL